MLRPLRLSRWRWSGGCYWELLPSLRPVHTHVRAAPATGIAAGVAAVVVNTGDAAAAAAARGESDIVEGVADPVLSRQPLRPHLQVYEKGAVPQA